VSSGVSGGDSDPYTGNDGSGEMTERQRVSTLRCGIAASVLAANFRVSSIPRRLRFTAGISHSYL